MRAGRSAQTVGHLNGACDAGAEADAVVGAGDVVVHGLGNGDDFDSFLVQTNAIAERVVTADGNHVVNAEPLEIFQHFRSEIVFLGVVLGLEMIGNVGLADLAGVGARGVEKGAAGAAGAIDDILGRGTGNCWSCRRPCRGQCRQAAPAVANANDLVAFAKRAEGDAANGGIETGNVAASGENADDAFLGVDVCHV